MLEKCVAKKGAKIGTAALDFRRQVLGGLDEGHAEVRSNFARRTASKTPKNRIAPKKAAVVKQAAVAKKRPPNDPLESVRPLQHGPLSPRQRRLCIRCLHGLCLQRRNCIRCAQRLCLQRRNCIRCEQRLCLQRRNATTIGRQC